MFMAESIQFVVLGLHETRFNATFWSSARHYSWPAVSLGLRLWMTMTLRMITRTLMSFPNSNLETIPKNRKLSQTRLKAKLYPGLKRSLRVPVAVVKRINLLLTWTGGILMSASTWFLKHFFQMSPWIPNSLITWVLSFICYKILILA